MTTQVGRWGNSLAVRIPRAYANELELSDGSQLELVRVSEGILIRPRKREYKLSELLARVKPENLHGETDWGPPVGNEAW